MDIRPEEADIVILNTCSVKGLNRELWVAGGETQKGDPDLVIAVGGYDP